MIREYVIYFILKRVHFPFYWFRLDINFSSFPTLSGKCQIICNNFSFPLESRTSRLYSFECCFSKSSHFISWMNERTQRMRKCLSFFFFLFNRIVVVDVPMFFLAFHTRACVSCMAKLKRTRKKRKANEKRFEYEKVMMADLQAWGSDFSVFECFI